MDGNLEKEKEKEQPEQPTEDGDWIRLHKKVQYFEILLLVISLLCLVSLVINAVNFYLFSRG